MFKKRTLSHFQIFQILNLIKSLLNSQIFVIEINNSFNQALKDDTLIFCISNNHKSFFF